MSHTCGLTAAPPPWGGAEMVVLMPPVAAYAAAPCNWYCQRLWSPGCQQPEHGVGAGNAAEAGATPRTRATSASTTTALWEIEGLRMPILLKAMNVSACVTRAVHHSPAPSTPLSVGVAWLPRHASQHAIAR